MEDIKKKKILMTLMQLQIGGAETHVLELSLELQRQGYEVVVASNGGVYEKNLAEAGIRHYKVPMHTKSPKNMSVSLARLARIIRRENIAIVHAHGRIPAFLCGILHHFMHFTFVTTAHWVFSTGHGLKYLSDWGEKVMAVSEDIKTYLMDNYHTNPSDIYVTINGIDTDKFSPEADYFPVMEEFGLSQESRKIVYISRMDEDRALVAFQLVSIVPELLKQEPALEVVIVGNGNVYHKLEEEANRINQSVGRRAVILAGAQTEIYRFAAMSDIFIGVSRSALEAMACARPVVVAGNEGYLGIFDEDKLASGIETNFCCRGLVQSSPELLLADVKKLLANALEENARLGTFGREVIKQHYSLKKMAEDCVKMYRAAVDPLKWDAVVSGYYGFQNSGDEALLFAMIENLRRRKDDVRLLVLSKAPAKTAAEYGVHSINRYNLFKLWRALKKSHLLLSGGGSLLQDVTSNKSLWYYLAVISLAQKAGTDVLVYANGIGPIQKEKNREKASRILSRCSYITLREPASMEEICSLGVPAERVEITADPALTICPAPEESMAPKYQKWGIRSQEAYLGISVRAWKGCDNAFWQEVAAAVDGICEKYGMTPLLLPLKHPEDVVLSKELAQQLQSRSILVQDILSANEIVSLVGRCRLMLCMRLHSLIYAADVGVPTVGISYDPKVKGFTRYLGLDNVLEVQDITRERLANELQYVEENRESIKKALCQNVAQLKEKAEMNADIALRYMTK